MKNHEERLGGFLGREQGWIEGVFSTETSDETSIISVMQIVRINSRYYFEGCVDTGGDNIIPY